MLRRSIEEGPQYVPLILDALPRWAELTTTPTLPVTDLRGAIRIAPIGSPMHAAFVASARRLGPRLRPSDRRRGQPTVPGVLGARRATRRCSSTRPACCSPTARCARCRTGRPATARRCTSTNRSSRGRPTGDSVVVRTATATYHAARLVITARRVDDSARRRARAPARAEPGRQRVVHTARTRTVRGRPAAGVHRQRRHRRRVRHPGRRRPGRQGRRRRHAGRSRSRRPGRRATTRSPVCAGSSTASFPARADRCRRS